MNVCFFRFSRSGEICGPVTSTLDESEHKPLGDVSVDNHAAPSRVFITIKASKTGPFQAGVIIVLGQLGEICAPCLPQYLFFPPWSMGGPPVQTDPSWQGHGLCRR